MKALKVIAGIAVFPLLMLSGIGLALIGLLMSDHR